jgi:hypothetical protein
MANITEAIHELIDNIENGNHVEANNIFNDLLQAKIDALIDAKKVEVSSAMFNTENCADCDEENVDEAAMLAGVAARAAGTAVGRTVAKTVAGQATKGSARHTGAKIAGQVANKATQQAVMSSASKKNEDVEKTNEALKGAQHKIDMNKNGKLDAMDFKMLRKKK